MTVVWSDSADFSFSQNKVATPTLFDLSLLTVPGGLVDANDKGILVYAIAVSALPGTVYPGSTIVAASIGQMTATYVDSLGGTEFQGSTTVFSIPFTPTLHGSSVYGGLCSAGPGMGIAGFPSFPGLFNGGVIHLTGCLNDTTERFNGTIVAIIDDGDNGTPNGSGFTGAIAGFTSGIQPIDANNDVWGWPTLSRSGTADALSGTSDNTYLFGASAGASVDSTPTAIDFTGAAGWENVIQRTSNASPTCFSGQAGFVVVLAGSSQTDDTIPIGTLPSGASSIIVQGSLGVTSGIASTFPVITGQLFAVNSSGTNIGTFQTVVTPSGGGAATSTFGEYDLPAGTAGIRASVTCTAGSGVISFSGRMTWQIALRCNNDHPYSYAATIARYTGTLPSASVSYFLTNPTPTTNNHPSIPNTSVPYSGVWQIIEATGVKPGTLSGAGRAYIIA